MEVGGGTEGGERKKGGRELSCWSRAMGGMRETACWRWVADLGGKSEVGRSRVKRPSEAKSRMSQRWRLGTGLEGETIAFSTIRARQGVSHGVLFGFWSEGTIETNMR